MKGTRATSTRITLLLLLLSLIMAGCASSRVIRTGDVDAGQSVKLYLHSGEIVDGVVLESGHNEILFVGDTDHQKRTIAKSEIRRIEHSPQDFDYQAFPISNAEIQKYKQSKNTWGYAIGGGIVGGIGGLAVGIPIWLANDDPPPLLAAGLGFVLGSIYFATRGIKKDREEALTQVRVLRQKEEQLDDKRKAEIAKLKAIQEQKAKLLKELEEKKKKDQK